MRRDERQIIIPPIWRVDSPYVSVRFKKKFSLDLPEQVVVLADGSLRLVIDGTMFDSKAQEILLTEGEHKIIAEVVNLIDCLRCT